MPTSRKLHKIGFALGVFVCVASTAAMAQTVPAADPLRGDGRVSAFYSWDKTIPSKPGTLLRQEPLERTVGLPNAAQQFRVLFSSTDGVQGKDPIVVSGAVFIPEGTAPQGGWPVVSWGHGTFGGADICAPSWHARSYRDVLYLSTWLKAGFAVVASDYQGIGVPGYNPQFNNRSNAYTVIDIARAAIKGFPHLANTVFLVGQSQGGSAVVAAGGYAPAYAPDLNIRGIVGTGIVYRPGHPLTPLKAPDPDQANKVEPTIAYGFYHILAAQAEDPTVNPADIYSDLALPLVDQARTSCLAELEADVVGLGLTRNNAFKPGSGDALRKASGGDSIGQFPSVKLVAPLFIGAGADDDLAAGQIALAKDACAAGTTVEIHLYSQRDHSGAVNGSIGDSLPFVRKILAGQPIPPVCEPKIQ